MAILQAIFIKNITVFCSLYFYIKAIQIFHPFVIRKGITKLQTCTEVQESAFLGGL